MRPRQGGIVAVVLACLGWSGCASTGLDAGLGSLVMSAADDSVAAAGRTAVAVRPEWATAGGDSATLGQVILLLPLRDATSYLKRSPWPVHAGIPHLIGDSLATNSFFHILPVDSAAVVLTEPERQGDISVTRALAVGRFLGADWVVLGSIEALTMNRFQATAPIGGHRSYKGVAAVRLTLYNVVDGRNGGEVVVEEEVDNKRTGIANPASYVNLDKQYFFLDDIPWGSSEFTASLVGQALAASAGEVAAQIAQLIKPPPQPGVSEPKVIDIDGDTAYINVGLTDGTRNGDKFGVWDHGRELIDPGTSQVLGHALPRRIGVVQVEQVLSDHLSLVRILDGQTSIHKGYSIRPE